MDVSFYNEIDNSKPQFETNSNTGFLYQTTEEIMPIKTRKEMEETFSEYPKEIPKTIISSVESKSPDSNIVEEMPYQNRQENIKKIVRTLMSNRSAARTSQPSNRKLISFSQCMGTGKTRVTKDFLKIVNSEKYNKNLEPNERDIFENSLLFHFDMDILIDYLQIKNNFREAFYTMIYDKIFDILQIQDDRQNFLEKAAKSASFDNLQYFIKHAFIDKNIRIALDLFYDYNKNPEKLKVHEEKVEDYIKSNTKTKCHFVIFSFDEVGRIQPDMLEIESRKILENNFKNCEDSENQKMKQINLFYFLWRYYFHSFNRSEHIGVLVAGKNAYTPLIGETFFTAQFNHCSPSGIEHITLNSLSESDILAIFDELIYSEKYLAFLNLYNHFNNKPKLYQEIIELIHIYSGGLGRIVDFISRYLQNLDANSISKHCQSKETFIKFLENEVGKNSNLKNLNPFNQNENLFYLIFLAKSKTKFPKTKLASEVYGLCELCHPQCDIENAFLLYGIPYSQIENSDDLIISMPKFFELEFQKKSKFFNQKIYIYFFAKMQELKISFDKNRVFELLISLAFYKMLEISPNENVKFIEEKIDLNALTQNFAFESIGKIISKNDEIITDLCEYFGKMKQCSVNIPDDCSYGQDCSIKLKTHLTTKSIFVGLQMKNYFSERTELDLLDIQKEVQKMQNIINQMPSSTKPRYEKFYYVIVCPCYHQNVFNKYFTKLNPQNKFDSLKITQQDFCIFPWHDPLISVILLHPKCVSNLAGKEFIDSQDLYKLGL